MDTWIIALLVGYEALAFAWQQAANWIGGRRFDREWRRAEITGSTDPLAWNAPWHPPLLTEILDDTPAPVRWGFVGTVALTLVDHLSLIDVVWL